MSNQVHDRRALRRATLERAAGDGRLSQEARNVAWAMFYWQLNVLLPDGTLLITASAVEHAAATELERAGYLRHSAGLWIASEDAP